MLCFSILCQHISLLFLNEMVTICADGLSYNLFDPGLDITNFLVWPSANQRLSVLRHKFEIWFSLTA